jgi:hypothetical protein
VKHEARAAELDGMARVGTSLEACHDRVLRGEHIHDFTFSLVSPLETKNHVESHLKKEMMVFTPLSYD